MSCSEAGGSILCQRGDQNSPVRAVRGLGCRGRGRPELGRSGHRRAKLRTAFGRLFVSVRSEGELGIFLGTPPPPARAGLAEQAWKMVNDHLDQLQAFSWLVCHNS